MYIVEKTDHGYSLDGRDEQELYQIEGCRVEIFIGRSDHADGFVCKVRQIFGGGILDNLTRAGM